MVRRRPGAGIQERIAGIMRGQAPALSREQAAESLSADPAEIQQVSGFASSHGLTVIESSAEKGSVRISGTVAQMEAAFGVKLRACKTGGQTYIAHEDAVTIPAALDQVIVGVLGLDQRPVASPRS